MPGARSTVELVYQQTLSPYDVLLVSKDDGAIVGLQNRKGIGEDFRPLPIPITAAEVASPRADLIADIRATYQLNVAPYTRYQSNGTTLVALSSGGGGTLAALVSPDGNTWTLSVSNGGILTLTPSGVVGTSPLISPDGNPWRMDVSNAGVLTLTVGAWNGLLTSPDLTAWQLTVSNAGILSVTPDGPWSGVLISPNLTVWTLAVSNAGVLSVT